MADLCEVTEEEFFTQTDEELIVKEMKMGEERKSIWRCC